LIAGTAAAVDQASFRTDVPARLDRLPWSRWHWRIVLALGITWVIDGLEVTLVGAVSPVLQRPDTLHLSSAQNGLLNTAYLIGAVLGSLLFGYLTDLWGRKKLRGLAIVLFYSTGTALGGPLASWLFGRLIDERQRVFVLYGDLLAAAILIGAACVVLLFGVKADRTSLEEVAEPLSAVAE
jgi:MFS family permease